MKKLLIVLYAALGALLFASCMHECSCITRQEFVNSAEHIVSIDTTLNPSKLDCSLMNLDTVYYSHDTTGAIVTDRYIVNKTICN